MRAPLIKLLLIVALPSATAGAGLALLIAAERTPPPAPQRIELLCDQAGPGVQVCQHMRAKLAGRIKPQP